MNVHKIISIIFLILFFSCSTRKNETLTIERKGTKISFNSCGSGDTTLLFIHGWCINKTYWQKQSDYFCRKYKVVTVDLPGFGLSAKNRNDWSFDEYAEDIKSVIDKLQLKNVVLAGHSMSGDIILKVSEKYPDNIAGIIGIDNLHSPGSPLDDKQQKEMDIFFEQLYASFDSTVAKYMRGVLFQPTTDTTVINRVMENIFSTDSIVAINVLQSLTKAAQQEKETMRKLNHRLYLINSDVMAVQADSLRKYCRYGFELQTVHATGHYPMIEKPEEFNQALEIILHKISQAQ